MNGGEVHLSEHNPFAGSVLVVAKTYHQRSVHCVKSEAMFAKLLQRLQKDELTYVYLQMEKLH